MIFRKVSFRDFEVAKTAPCPLKSLKPQQSSDSHISEESLLC